MVFGIIALIFGLAFLLIQGLTLTQFLIVFGYFILLSGMTLIGLNFRLYGSDSVNRHMNLIEGVIYVVFSLIALYPPKISTQMATILVGTFALNSGYFRLQGGS